MAFSNSNGVGGKCLKKSVAIELSQAGMFAAADLEDLITFLQSIKAKHFDDNLEDDHE